MRNPIIVLIVLVDEVGTIVRSTKFLATNPDIVVVAVSIWLLLLFTVVIFIVSIVFYVGGENNPFIENFNVVYAGIWIFDRLDIVTNWLVCKPAHWIPKLSDVDKLVQFITDVIGNLWLIVATSYAQYRLIGYFINILLPIGNILVVTIVNIISDVLFTIDGLNVIIVLFNEAGDKLTAEYGLFAE